MSSDRDITQPVNFMSPYCGSHEFMAPSTVLRWTHPKFVQYILLSTIIKVELMQSLARQSQSGV